MKLEIEITREGLEAIVANELWDYEETLKYTLENPNPGAPVYSHDMKTEQKKLRKDIKALKRVRRMFS